MYQFSNKHKSLMAEAIWPMMQQGLNSDVTIKSIRYKKPYTINYITDDAISFSATTRNNGEPEIITKEDFYTVVNLLKKAARFNTSSAKELFRGTQIYKKRSPLFALLLSSNVIEETSE